MDPAGPDFLNYNKAVLLDKSDAQFVDVIHTNGKPLIQGGAGLSTPTAHVDFYVNGGRTQPGCKDGLSGLFSGGERTVCTFLEDSVAQSSASRAVGTSSIPGRVIPATPDVMGSVPGLVSLARTLTLTLGLRSKGVFWIFLWMH